MDYLEKVLGIKVSVEKCDNFHFPNFIDARYMLQLASMDGVKVVFVYPKSDLEQIETLKKHIERIRCTLDRHVVLVLSELTFRQKEYLIRERIPFVVEGKQIYLPFMALYLQNRCNSEKQDLEAILPSSQLLFLYFIYHGAREIETSKASRDLCLTPTSISRASKQLEQMGLLNTRRVGVQKILFAEGSPAVLFQRAKAKLGSPVRRTVFVPVEMISDDLVESGYSALSRYSMLNEPELKCYASDGVQGWSDHMTNSLLDSRTQVAVELWKYNPRLLSKGTAVDELSLALALANDGDERVEESVEEMLNALWERIDGSRNR